MTKSLLLVLLFALPTSVLLARPPVKKAPIVRKAPVVKIKNKKSPKSLKQQPLPQPTIAPIATPTKELTQPITAQTQNITQPATPSTNSPIPTTTPQKSSETTIIDNSSNSKIPELNSKKEFSGSFGKNQSFGKHDDDDNQSFGGQGKGKRGGKRGGQDQSFGKHDDDDNQSFGGQGKGKRFGKRGGQDQSFGMSSKKKSFGKEDKDKSFDKRKQGVYGKAPLPTPTKSLTQQKKTAKTAEKNKVQPKTASKKTEPKSAKNKGKASKKKQSNLNNQLKINSKQ